MKMEQIKPITVLNGENRDKRLFRDDFVINTHIALGYNQALKDIYNGLPVLKNKPHYEPIDRLKGWAEGFNECLDQIKSAIKFE